MRAVTLQLALAAVAVLGTVSCLSIGARESPDTHHYVLSPVIETPSGGTANPAAPLVVGVGPVNLPAYLDRPQRVIRRAPDSIEIKEFDLALLRFRRAAPAWRSQRVRLWRMPGSVVRDGANPRRTRYVMNAAGRLP